MSLGTYGILFIESMYLQNVRHLSALATGAMIVPLTVAPTVTTRMIDRYGADMHFKPPSMAGLASGTLNAGRQVGGAIGVALMGTLVQMPRTRDGGIVHRGAGVVRGAERTPSLHDP